MDSHLPQTGKQLHSKRPLHRLLFNMALTAVTLLCLYRAVLAQIDEPAPADVLPYALYLPMIYTTAGSQQVMPTRDWDPRLTARGAWLVEAQVAPGEGYWHLVKARWFDPLESQGRHHILVDLLDSNSQRLSNVTVTVAWADGNTTITTEPKPGESYATNYAMYALAPAYAAQPLTDAPADRIEGMGLGTIEDPYRAFHTSYGLTWQWTIAASVPTITPTTTTTVTLTATPEVTTTPAVTVTVVPTVHLSPTPSATPTPTPSATATPAASATPTTTPTSTPTAAVLAQATVVGCQPNDRGSRFEGYVYRNQQPVNGYRVVFSYEADGPWVTQPVLSGSGALGFYAHIISVGVARPGNWYTWLVDQNHQRISTIASFATDGEGGSCNVVFVNFQLEPTT